MDGTNVDKVCLISDDCDASKRRRKKSEAKDIMAGGNMSTLNE